MNTIKHIRRYRELFKLLIAFLVYNDGIVTVIYFAALYASVTIGFTTAEIAIMFIAMNVVAAAGAFSFGWVADRIGQKRTILISLTIWLTAVVVAYFAYSKTSFYVVATLAGIGMGSCQSVTRSLAGPVHAEEERRRVLRLSGNSGQGPRFPGPDRLRHHLENDRKSEARDSLDRNLFCGRSDPDFVRE